MISWVEIVNNRETMGAARQRQSQSWIYFSGANRMPQGSRGTIGIVQRRSDLIDLTQPEIRQFALHDFSALLVTAHLGSETGRVVDAPMGMFIPTHLQGALAAGDQKAGEFVARLHGY